MARTLTNRFGTLEILFNKRDEKKAMIIDHNRKKKIIVDNCSDVYFFSEDDLYFLSEDDFVLIEKTDKSYKIYKLGYGFLLPNEVITSVYEVIWGDFIAAINLAGRGEMWYLLNIDGEIFNYEGFLNIEQDGNFLKVKIKNGNTDYISPLTLKFFYEGNYELLGDYIPVMEYANGNILVSNKNSNQFNILLPNKKFASEYDFSEIIETNKTQIFIVISGKSEMYNIVVEGKLFFDEWKYYIAISNSKNRIFVQDNTLVNIYNSDFTLLCSKVFGSKEEALEFIDDAR